tara:strand:- start:503 stop:1087 length:585 start_codon:yes stop_codon:yes gene_type:complete
MSNWQVVDLSPTNTSISGPSIIPGGDRETKFNLISNKLGASFEYQIDDGDIMNIQGSNTESGSSNNIELRFVGVLDSDLSSKTFISGNSVLIGLEASTGVGTLFAVKLDGVNLKQVQTSAGSKQATLLLHNLTNGEHMIEANVVVRGEDASQVKIIKKVFGVDGTIPDTVVRTVTPLETSSRILSKIQDRLAII